MTTTHVDEETQDCTYCGRPVDEENDTVFYTTPWSVDHYECAPLSEKRGE